MGCTSSKKRTTSVDDLTGQKNEQPLTAKKNGQLTSANDAKAPKSGGAGDASNAIQIPGAHTSFMAPDGIPFIDEDLDDEMETRAAVGNATTPNKSDVNRNVVQADVKSPTVAGQPPAVPSGPPTQPSDEQKKEAIGAEIMKREIEITQSSSTTGPSETVHVEQVVVTTTTETHAVNGVPAAGEEEQKRAAVKIQAGIRGFRDRQRVKALRASQQLNEPPLTESVTVCNGDEPVAVDGPAPDAAEHDTSHTLEVATDCNDAADMAHTPEMERAATKIQASFKGYKTRKSLGKIEQK